MVFTRIKNEINLYLCNKKWKKMHPESKINFATPIDLKKVDVGIGSYGSLNIIDYSPVTGKSRIKIGAYCSIALGNLFMLGGGHPLHFATTYPFLNMLYGKEESIDEGNIIIGDDVWIGAQVTIMSGVNIGQGAVIGAKALVTKDIPPYSIAVGIPARVIKYRFNEEIISELLKIDFSSITKETVQKNINLFERPVNMDTVKKIQRLQNK